MAKKYKITIYVFKNGIEIDHKTYKNKKNKLYLSNAKNNHIFLPTKNSPKKQLFLEISEQEICVTTPKKTRDTVIIRKSNYSEPAKDGKEVVNFGDSFFIDIEDYRVLVHTETDKTKTKTKKVFCASFFNLYFSGRNEKIAACTSLLSVTTITLCVIYMAIKSNEKSSLSLKKLRPKHLYHIVAKDALETSPEALKFKLNRESYWSSTIHYYKKLANILKKEDKLLLHTNQKNTSYLLNLKLKTNEKVAVPCVYGKNIEQKVLSWIERIDKHQKGLYQARKLRVQITELFSKDPPYDWGNYKDLNNKSSSTATDQLSKITVLKQLRNEQEMYNKARTLGLIAQQTQENFNHQVNKENNWLDQKSLNILYLERDNDKIRFSNSFAKK